MTGRSRYVGTGNGAAAGSSSGTRSRKGADGTPIVYLSRRLLPLPDQIAIQSTYIVQPGDRIDLVAARLLGDPLLYSLLADANGADDPASLCATPGRALRIPAPLGQPGTGLDGGSSGGAGQHADDEADS